MLSVMHALARDISKALDVGDARRIIKLYHPNLNLSAYLFLIYAARY